MTPSNETTKQRRKRVGTYEIIMDGASSVINSSITEAVRPRLPKLIVNKRRRIKAMARMLVVIEEVAATPKVVRTQNKEALLS